MRISVIFLFLSLTLYFSDNVVAQERTIGLLSYKPDASFEGLNLIYPHGQSTVFLVNNCGEIVKTWEDDPDNVPGNSVYINDKGDLIRASRYFDRTNDAIWAGGGGAYIESIDWDGNLNWSFELNNDTARLHHDFEVLPSGHVLMIAWEKFTDLEAIENGRDTAKLNQDQLWPDFILEYAPDLDSVVWEWHAWDHLIQDHDSSKLNFGIVSTHPEKIDINFETNSGNPDWLHTNSIDYHEELDQIILSVPHFNEIWIIDHSTSTEEAKTSLGGNAGMGGDLLFRWGNPLTYRQGSESDQKLFFQHDAHWIRDFIDSGDPYYNQILLFNNRAGNDFSTVNLIATEREVDSLNYSLQDTTFLPRDFKLEIRHPLLSEYFSSGLSSTQYLPNGNFLILAGRYGYAFELNKENEIVWEYRVPIISGQAVVQGSEPIVNENLTFRLKRYPLDYSGFEGRDLSPKGFIQLDDIDDLCNRVVGIDEQSVLADFSIFPNPAFNDLNIITEISVGSQITIMDPSGRTVMRAVMDGNVSTINISSLSSGLYFIKMEGHQVKKFIKVN